MRYYPRKEHWNTPAGALLAEAASKDRQILRVFRSSCTRSTPWTTRTNSRRPPTRPPCSGRRARPWKFMEKGYATGVLENSGDKTKSQALLAESKRLAASDQKTLPQFEKEAGGQGRRGGREAGRGVPELRSTGQGPRGHPAGHRQRRRQERRRGQPVPGPGVYPYEEYAGGFEGFRSGNEPEYAQLAQLWSIHAGQR
ncbi:MAG: hypothetical protein MZV49_04860 [Rhodopseudomonas palustris]|nr:hypothetical protein [Rhodopseudomonas palustris]